MLCCNLYSSYCENSLSNRQVHTSLKSPQKSMLSSPQEHNWLESLIKKKKNHVIFVSEYIFLYLTASTVISYFSIVITGTKAQDFCSMRPQIERHTAHYVNESIWPLVNVAEAALSTTEWNFSRRCIVPVMRSYHSCFDSKAADLRSILSCSCLDGLTGPSIMDDLLALTFRQA